MAAVATRPQAPVEIALDAAAKAGVTQVIAVCSLVGGGYSEDGPRQHWSAVAKKGPAGRHVGTARGNTSDEAVLGALRALEIIE